MCSYYTSSVTSTPNMTAFCANMNYKQPYYTSKSIHGFIYPLVCIKSLFTGPKLFQRQFCLLDDYPKKRNSPEKKDLKPHKEGFKAKYHRRLVTFTSSFITSTNNESTTPH